VRADRRLTAREGHAIVALASTSPQRSHDRGRGQGSGPHRRRDRAVVAGQVAVVAEDDVEQTRHGWVGATRDPNPRSTSTRSLTMSGAPRLLQNRASPEGSACNTQKLAARPVLDPNSRPNAGEVSGMSRQVPSVDW